MKKVIFSFLLLFLIFSISEAKMKRIEEYYLSDIGQWVHVYEDTKRDIICYVILKKNKKTKVPESSISCIKNPK
jgi:hypothetical protein